MAQPLMQQLQSASDNTFVSGPLPEYVSAEDYHEGLKVNSLRDDTRLHTDVDLRSKYVPCWVEIAASASQSPELNLTLHRKQARRRSRG